MNPIVNYHLRLNDCSVSTPTIFIYSFENKVVLGGSDPSVKAFIKKNCKLHAERGDYLYGYIDNKIDDVVDSIRNFKVVCGGTVKEVIRSHNIDFVSLASFSVSYLFFKNDVNKLFSFASLLDRLVNDVSKILYGYEDGEDYRVFSSSRKIVVSRIDGDVNVSINSLKIDLEDGKRYVIFATYDESEVDGEVLGVFDNPTDFARFFIETFGDLDGLKMFMDDYDIRNVYPLLISKDLSLIKRQMDVYYKEDHYTKYLSILFPGFNYSLTIRHADLFFLHFIYDFIFNIAKYSDNTDSKDFLGILSSAYKKYIDKIAKGKTNLRYRKSDIMNVIDSLNSVLINDDILYKKILSFFRDNIDKVLDDLHDPSEMDSKHYRHFVRVVNMFKNFLDENMSEADYDFVLSFMKDNIEHVFVYSDNDVRRILSENKLLTYDKEGYLTGIKVLRLSRLISGYIIYLLCVSMSADSIYDLSPDRKSKSVKVYVKEYSSIVAFLSLIDRDRVYGNYLYLSVVLFILSHYLSNKSNIKNNVFYVPVSESKLYEFDVSLIESILSVLSKANVNFKKLDVKSLERYHKSLSNYYPFYGLISSYYDYLNERATFFNLSLFPHQDRAVSKMLEGYISGNDGFILSHSTGSGKTITIAKNMADLINHRRSQGLSTKILFISKNEIIEKVAKEVIYFIPEGYFYIVDSIKDIEEIHNSGKYPDILAISFKMLSLYLSDEVVSNNIRLFDVSPEPETSNEEQESQEEGGFEVTDSITDGSDIHSFIKSKMKKKDNVKSDSMSKVNEQKILDLFYAYNIIYIDEAHYVKNVYVVDSNVNGHSFMSRRYDSAYRLYPDIRKYDMYYIENVSKIAAIMFYAFMEYVSKKYINGVYIPESERKFFVLSTGTVFSNYPHESWVLFYLTGVYFREAQKYSEIQYLADIINFSKLFYKTDYKDYDRFVDAIRSANKNISIDDILELANDHVPWLKDKNTIFKSIVDIMSKNNYLDIYTESDALRDGLLTEPVRKVAKISIKSNLSSISKSNLANINSNYFFIENIDEFLDNVKEVFKIYLKKTRNKTSKGYEIKDTSNRFVKMLNSYIDVNSVNYKNVANIIDIFLEDNSLDIFYKKDLLNVYYNTMRGLPSKLTMKRDNDSIDLDIPYDSDILVTDNILSGKSNISFKLGNFLDSTKKSINVLDSLINSFNYNHLMLSSYDFIQFMYYDMIMKWVKSDNGIVPGTGKSFVVVEHVKWGKYLFYSIAEFIHNIIDSVKNDKAIDLANVIKTCADNYLNAVLANMCLSNLTSINPHFYSFFIRNVSDIINELVNIKAIIESTSIERIGSKDLEEIISSFYKITLYKRNIIFIAALVNNKFEDRSHYIEDYYLSYLYSKYGKEFFNFGRYFNAYFGGLSIKNEKDSMLLLRNISGDKLKIYNQHSTVFDYLKHLGLITDNIYANMFKEIKDIKSKSDTFFSNRNRYFSDLLVSKVFKKGSDSGVGKVKMILSENFMNNKDVRVILSNARSVAEGLNFKGGNVMYILDFGYSIGLLSQIEARINRLGNEVPIEIYYVLSDLNKDYAKMKWLFIKDFLSYFSGFNSKNIYMSFAQDPFDPLSYLTKDSIRKDFSAIKDYLQESKSTVKVGFLSSYSGDKLVFYVNNNKELEEEINNAIPNVIEESMYMSTESSKSDSDSKDEDDIDID